jgi:paraquat-inducible protein B
MADRQAAIGAFVFGGIVLGLAALVFFGNFRLFQPTRSAAVVFEGSISGLSVGAPVTFRGVRVGAVQRIVIQFDAAKQTAVIPVTLQLETGRVRISGESKSDAGLDLATLIARGLRAELNVQSFVTGQSQIELDFDPRSAAILHPGLTNLAEIPVKPSTIQRVTQRLSELPLRDLVDSASATLESVRQLSAKLDEDLPPLTASLRTTAEGASTTVQVATRAMTDLQTKLDSTLGRIGQLATTSDQQLVQRSADLHALLTSSNQSVQQVHEVLNNLRSITSDRGETRANLEAALRDLAAAAASLRGFAGDVERNPQLLLTGRRP